MLEDDINELMEDDDGIILKDSEETLGIEPLVIDLEQIDEKSLGMAQEITSRLSNFFFDEKYIEEHPYIPTKIWTEMDTIRRLLKMLAVNETAQDSLIKAIAVNAGKGTLYISLTSLQKSILLIQKQMWDRVAALEEIFRKMQEEAEKTFAEADKEDVGDGTMVMRGSKEFIKEIQKMYESSSDGKLIIKKKELKDNLNKDLDNKNQVPEGATPLSEIIG